MQIMLLIILNILLPIIVVDSALVEFPNNIAVTAVTDATKHTEFKCKADKGYELKWFFQPNNTAQKQLLSSGQDIMSEKTKSYCDIQNDEPGEFNLILNIQDESAQTYTCQEPNTNQERSAELIKIEPNKFEKYVSESHVILDCSVNFRGNWAPELELSHNGTSVLKGVDASVVPNRNVSTTLIIPRNDSTLAGNYSCTARFYLRGKPKQTTDNSVPSYLDTSILTVDMTRPGIRSESRPNSRGPDKVITIVCTFVAVVVLILLAVGCWRSRHYCKNNFRRERTQRTRDVGSMRTTGPKGNRPEHYYQACPWVGTFHDNPMG